MDFDSVVEKRVSVRSFKNKKASWKDILEAIDAAIKAPSAGKMHHFKFVVIEDQEKVIGIDDVGIGDAQMTRILRISMENAGEFILDKRQELQ